MPMFMTTRHSSVSLCCINSSAGSSSSVVRRFHAHTSAFHHLPAFHPACQGSFSASIRLDRSRSAKIESLSFHRPRSLDTPLYTLMTITRSDRFADRAELSDHHRQSYRQTRRRGPMSATLHAENADCNSKISHYVEPKSKGDLDETRTIMYS
jgi:hypothetical protein